VVDAELGEPVSRAGYSDGGDDQWSLIRWGGVIASATRGKRGQEFFRALVQVLDDMENKRLIKGSLADGGEVCALGAFGRANNIHLAPLEAAIEDRDYDKLGEAFGIAPALAREIMYQNDDIMWDSAPEARWRRLRAWAAEQIILRPEELVTP
jgi:hypothetical protein